MLLLLLLLLRWLPAENDASVLKIRPWGPQQ
jgi:hypothetical protein